MQNIFLKIDEYVKKALETTTGQLIYKYIFRPKSFHSLVFVFGVFLYKELQAIFFGEKISTFCQIGIQKSDSVYEEYFFKAIEFFFVNGNWITVVILLVILIALFWIRHLELKFTKKQFKPILKWAKERLSLALIDIGRRYITHNNDEYKELHISTNTEKFFLYYDVQKLYNEYDNIIQGRYQNSYFYDEIYTADMAPSYDDARNRCAAYLGEDYYEECFSVKKDDLKIETFKDSNELIRTKELTHQILDSLREDDYKSVSNLSDELIVLLRLIVNEMKLRIHFVEVSDMRHESDTYDVDRMFISDAVYEVERVLDFLASEKMKIYTKRTLILTGEALTGKTHLLCKLAETRIENKKPTLLCFGHKFNNTDTPLYQMAKQLDIQNYNLSEEDLLVILNDWGKEANDFTLLIFDAINETDNKNIWRYNLKSLVEKIELYPYIRLILSVRDVEKFQVISQSDEQFLIKKTAQIEHRGFNGIEIAVLKKFCSIFDINLPTFPLVNPIFANPGLLFLFFETLKRKEVRSINENILRPNFIIEEFVQDVNTRFIERFNTFQRKQYVVQTTNIASKEIVNNNYVESIYYDDIIDLTTHVHEAILDYLISEGIFITNVTKLHEQVLNFSYQKFGNYFIALYLLSDYVKGNFTPDSIKESLQKDTRVIDLITNVDQHQAIIEAFMTRLSESFDLDILDIFPKLKSNIELMGLRLSSLVNAEKIPDSISNVLSKVNLISDEERNYYLKFLLTHSWKAESPFNITLVLHPLLISEQLNIRDSWWSIFLHHDYSNDGMTKRIIKWAWDKSYDYKLEEKSLFLYGLTLSWFLVSSNRELRDGTTKALVNLFTNNTLSFLSVLKEFEKVDDLYILERLYAAAYGIVLRSQQTDGFKELGNYIYNTIFNVDFVVEHILLREYASQTLEYIDNLLNLSIDKVKIYPPYNQNHTWTLPKIEKAEIEKYRDDYLAIYRSVLDGDFKIYKIYPAINHFLDLKILDRPHNKLPKDRYDNFFDSLTAEQHEEYNKVKMASNELLSLLNDFTEDKFEEEIKGCDFELDKIKTLKETKLNLSRFKELLSSEQFKEYNEFILIYDKKHEYKYAIDIKSIKRLIFLEAIKLGWDKKLFGDFDKKVNSWDRYEHRSERIGKKYQWIAFHSVLAKLTDNYEYQDGRNENKISLYKGTYQFFLRDIDPTTIQKNKNKVDEKWWFNINDDFENLDISDKEWMESTEKLPKISQLIEINKDGKGYLIQSMSFSIDGTNENSRYRNLYYLINAFILNQSNLDNFIEWLSSIDFYGQDKMPKSSDIQKTFLREYPNSKTFAYFNNYYYGQTDWDDKFAHGEGGIPCQVLLTSTSYMNEGRSYDTSVDEPLEIALPNKWLIDQMGLNQTLKDGEWVNGENEVVFFDPTIDSCFISEYNENSVLVADKELLFKFLESNGLTMVWIMWGEKQVRNATEKVGEDDCFLGIGEISGYLYIENNKFKEFKKIKYEQ